MSTPKWITPGEPVVIVTTSSHMRSIPRITRTSIDRVLKRDIVCADGSRWRLDKVSTDWEGHEYVRSVRGRNSDSWSPLPTLYPASSPKVTDIIEERRLAELRSNALRSADDLLSALRRGKYDDAKTHLVLVQEAMEMLG